MIKIKRIIKDLIYYGLSLLNFLIPKNKNRIFLYDRKYKKDNVHALAEYLSNSSYNYDVIYYTQDIPLVKLNNIRYINKFHSALWNQMRSSLVVYSYRGDGFIPFKSFWNQKIVDTMHGSPLKAIGYSLTDEKINSQIFPFSRSFDYILCLSDYFKDVVKKRFGASEEQCLVLGYPRNDMIFEEESFVAHIDIDSKFEKVILWMPTWRNPIIGNSGISEDKYSFPILNLENIQQVNKLLESKKILLVIKPHPFQASLKLFEENQSNIKTIDNDFLDKHNINLYKTLNSFDGLITDYSSIYFDYLLTNKRIGFTIDDFELYSEYQGFSVDDPLSLMPGDKITDLNGLINFFDDVLEDADGFSHEREEVNRKVNKYTDNNSSKRFIEFFENIGTLKKR
uniref:CDP-glycerol:poly(Glycerophosphate) glycerophosphotransferase n=1 Tax=Erysipelothrix rhusiopathiae TaxID=1648 RepID=A0A6S6I0Y7_ERYRH|nr:CDP-glycerol:poly(glycerophosphate) glycerophosphotransferase [Erysipelothrix rhusiopathiae]